MRAHWCLAFDIIFNLLTLQFTYIHLLVIILSKIGLLFQN